MKRNQRLQTIGVAIATFNGEEFLVEQLESIFRQTRLPDFIAISDDASIDRTVELARTRLGSGGIPFVLSVNTTRLGVADNFKKAFSLCDTDYIVYCDQDDVWDIHKIEEYASVICGQSYSLVFHQSLITDKNLRSSNVIEPRTVVAGRYIFPHIPDYVWGFGHEMMFSKQVAKTAVDIQISGYTSLVSLGKNLDKTLLLAAGMTGDFFFIDRPLTLFRRHQSSVSAAAKGSERQIRRFNLNLNDRINFTEKHIQLLEELSSYSQKRGQRAFLFYSHAKKLLNIYKLRHALMTTRSRMSRLSILVKLVLLKAYGSERNNKIPMRQFILDVYSAILNHGHP